MAAKLVLLICLALFKGAQGAQWSSSSPPDGHVMYACVDDTVSILWEYILDSGDVLNEITWLYEGHSQEMVAFLSHGQFIVLPAFSNRVVDVGNAGIRLKRAVVGDTGNYTVEIQVIQQPGNTNVVIRRRIFLQISSDLVTTDGQLHATQNQHAVLNTNTNQWSIQLRCGTFSFATNPPFPVEWETPSGQVLNSTDFADHHFTLLLDNPPQGGNYTCRIPSQHSAQACLHGNAGHQGEATVYLDKVDARFTLLEKENQLLKEQLSSTQSELEAEKLKTTSLPAEVLDLQHRLQKLEDAERHQVAFQAIYISPSTVESGQNIKFSDVLYNQGQAYDSSTGYFTASFSGIYYFIASTGCSTENAWAQHSLYVDNHLFLGLAHTYRSTGNDFAVASVHGVVHLNAGQRVSIINYSRIEFLGGYHSHFSGFLLSRDP